MLKFQEQVLLALTKTPTNCVFQNLPWGRFRSIFEIFMIFEIALKSPPGQIFKIEICGGLS